MKAIPFWSVNASEVLCTPRTSDGCWSPWGARLSCCIVRSHCPVTLTNGVGMRFYSMTVRFFKLPQLEDRCEDMKSCSASRHDRARPNRFVLDDHHVFMTGKPMLVCSNTAAMLKATRFEKHFRVEGDLSTHYGLFDCGPEPSVEGGDPGACC